MQRSKATGWLPSLWKNTFESVLDQELDNGDDWTLAFNYGQTDQISQQDRKLGWKVTTYCAYGKFACSQCFRSWGSAKVTLVLRYRLRRNMERGTVILRPFGQACQSCNADFYMPGFSEQEVEKALLHLFKKIRKNCYGEVQEDVDELRPRLMKKGKPHETSLCEACQDGTCCIVDE